MARYALIASACGHVVNVFELEDLGAVSPPAGHELVEDAESQAGPGSHWDGSGFNHSEQLRAVEEVTTMAEAEPEKPKAKASSIEKQVAAVDKKRKRK